MVRGATVSVTVSALYSVWTDGACEPNPGIGGWGYLIRGHGDSGVIEAFGGELNTTNNRMELTAVLMALQCLPDGAQAVIHSDSTYVVNGLTAWRTRWRKRGWCRKTGEPMLNRDLWLLLEAQALRVAAAQFRWVRGHSGEAGNERADRLAAAGRAGTSVSVGERA